MRLKIMDNGKGNLQPKSKSSSPSAQFIVEEEWRGSRTSFRGRTSVLPEVIILVETGVEETVADRELFENPGGELIIVSFSIEGGLKMLREESFRRDLLCN